MANRKTCKHGDYEDTCASCLEYKKGYADAEKEYKERAENAEYNFAVECEARKKAEARWNKLREDSMVGAMSSATAKTTVPNAPIGSFHAFITLRMDEIEEARRDLVDSVSGLDSPIDLENAGVEELEQATHEEFDVAVKSNGNGNAKDVGEAVGESTAQMQEEAPKEEKKTDDKE